MRNPFAAYAVTLAALAAALLLRWFLDPWMGDTLPLVTLFGAVAAAVWVGGLAPAALTAIVGYVACAYLYIEPRGELGLDQPRNVIGLLAYLFTCSLIIGFGSALRIARTRSNENRDLLRVTLASIGDAVITTDTDGRVAYLNDVGETLTGWTSAQAAGRPLEEVFRIVNEETRKTVENPAIRALRDGAVVGLANHTLLIRKDGTECPIDDSAAPIKNEEGRVSGCVLVVRDVTERRRLEKTAQARLLSARLLASIVESSDDAIVSKSLNGVIQSWNAAAERLFGYSAEQAIGRHISLIIPADRLTEEDRIVETLKAGRRTDHFETERVRSDGAHVPVSLTISPITDEAGNVVGASKIARDITRQREAEADRQKLTDDLSEADRRKDEFLATLAHELRNPLAPLSNMLDFLKRAGGANETARQAIDTMDRQLHQLVRLVDDLLDLSRISHNRLELRSSRVDLGAVLQETVADLRSLMESLGHEVRVIVPGDPIYLSADSVRLSQVFDNLLNNACKYTARGGRIDVTLERRGNEAIVCVRDSGTGIPADKLSTIFNMFTQVNRTQGGLGIGLTLVKLLVEMHGGSVEARSGGEGLGSEFVVTLPVMDHDEEQSEEVPPPASSQRPARACRILVVDDNVDAASSLVMLLQLEDNDARMVHDGKAALRDAEELRPDLVLLDIGLPEMNGYEVCRRMRERSWGEKALIIALTGWGQEDDRRKSREAGFDGHLVKPVKHAELMALLAQAQQRGDSNRNHPPQAVPR